MESQPSLVYARAVKVFEVIIRWVLLALIVLMLIALVSAVGKSAFDLVLAFHEQPDEILENLLLDVVLIIASIEIALMITAYLREGHVRVRYILDTVIVILSSEFIAVWFKHASLQATLGLCASVLTLTIVRLLSARLE
jgi:uncharacterized membrane protein (DUF373 family)